ncbi:MAG: helicase RepA family protein [Eubacteriaceae bacterium]|nr:helicase RepA family protein [Eubacteriaceae bacterium]
MAAKMLSVAPDSEQPLEPITSGSIPQYTDDFEVMDREKVIEIFGESYSAEMIEWLSTPNDFHTVSLNQLYDTVYKPKAQIVDNLLYAGVYLFAGAPKIGKSFFMAQLGYHVSRGLPIWDYMTHQGSVLYLALEDDYSRLQKRLSKMFGTEGSENLLFATKAKVLKSGLMEQLEGFISERKDTKLIIIDTLQRIRELGAEKFNYANDYEVVLQLKQFADLHNICILLVHHTRKQGADDCFDTISGTNGLLGAADGAFVMQKAKRTDNNAVMDIVGRDQQDQRLHLCFDRERCVWQLIEADTELWKEPPNPLIEAIATLVSSESPIWSGSATELLEWLPALEIQPNILSRKLNVEADRLWNEYGIRYENWRTHYGKVIKLTLSV